jgi:thioredoxin reductase
MIETAIIGAGPYGLSIAAHFRSRGISFRVFGRPMDSWLRHMPKGMHLKSDGFASNLSDSEYDLTLKHFCTERGIEYDDLRIPVALDTFTAYGLTFAERKVPELEDKQVVGVDRVPGGFVLRLDTGETLSARRVVLAVGITHFAHIPASLANLPPQYVSHSFDHRDLEPFRDRNVVVLGGGASASDMAGLLHAGGTNVQIVSRQPTLKFHSPPSFDKPRSLWQRIRHPQSGLGPGLRSRIYADAPVAFHYLPESVRLDVCRKHLGPSGGWFAKEMVIGKVPLSLGCTLERAEIKDGKVSLHLRTADGTQREFSTEHVIAATGYKVDMERLTFLSEEIRASIKTVEKTPILSSSFESSIPGMYFVGVAAMNSFGPLMRFAFGADFAARHITRAMKKAVAKGRASVSAPSPVTTAE